ncbi:hypothetical protein EVC08_006 [Rhizobium phage RHph_N65]|nr:hypothetical protein EVC08_006 [Rhizobium phage RHph_N65]
MKIDPVSVADVAFVATHMRDRDYEEFSAVSPADDRPALAQLLSARYGDRPDVMCGSADGTPICIGGTIEARPNVITLLFFATDDFPKIALPITRFIRKNLFPKLIAAGAHRIEAVSMAGYDQTHAWLRTIGLEQETGLMHGYGKRGEAFVQFSWSANVRPFGA